MKPPVKIPAAKVAPDGVYRMVQKLGGSAAKLIEIYVKGGQIVGVNDSFEPNERNIVLSDYHDRAWEEVSA